MRYRRRFLWLLISLSLVFCIASAVAGAEPEDVPYGFLSELATIQPVPGFPSALFTPERQPSRIEIAFFLFRLDQRLAAVAASDGLDLHAALARAWLGANPGADLVRARVWAETAAQGYRKLLIAYNREMGALGYRLRADAYPSWSGRNTTDVLGY